MKHIDLLEEAQDCRRKALTYLGQPEAALLLRVAQEFEQMSAEQRTVQRSGPRPRLNDIRSRIRT